jgi:OOP family OmpA-OmpF porin
MSKLKNGPKLAVILVVAGAAMFGLKTVGEHFGIGILKSVNVGKANLPDIKDAVVTDVQPVSYPTSHSNGCADPIRSEVWAWNSQIGWLYSNGGPETTKGSLAEKHQVCLKFNRQDDTTQMAADLVACANDLRNSTECDHGVHFITIMADGSGQFFSGLNAQLKKVCPTCVAEGIGTTGRSNGEDALWGPEPWKRNPKLALGDGLIAGVVKDGDWNTAQKWAGDNNLRNNPDEKTYDPSALNWVNSQDYIKAAEMYTGNHCEDRKVKIDDKLTGEVKNVCVKAVVTWTPGDVNIAHNKGGIVRIVSTKQYRSQMPSAVIGIKKWNTAHADKVSAMLAAALEGGDQVKAFPEALKRAGEISAKVYGEQTGDYWVRYYKGVTENDATGKPVELGGSYADNMNDALAMFGLSPGANNNVKATYTTFARIVSDQYPDLFKKTPIPPYDQVFNTNYLLQAKSLLDNGGSQADTQQYSADTQLSNQVSDKDWSIEFASGSDQLTNNGVETVKQIKDQVAITGLTVVLNGHTDNTGDRKRNESLSEARAESVRKWLQRAAPAEFPDARFRVHGYGQTKPVADNSTADGRARNRRVEVILAE